MMGKKAATFLTLFWLLVGFSAGVFNAVHIYRGPVQEASSELPQLETVHFQSPDLPDQSGHARFIKNILQDVRFNTNSFRTFIEDGTTASLLQFYNTQRIRENDQIGSSFRSNALPLFISQRALRI